MTGWNFYWAGAILMGLAGWVGWGVLAALIILGLYASFGAVVKAIGGHKF